MINLKFFLRFGLWALTLSCLGFYALRIDWGDFTRFIFKTSPWVIAYGFFGFFITLSLATLRLNSVYRAFSIVFERSDMVRLSLQSQAGNLIHMAGGVTAHFVSSHTKNVPVSIKILAPILEKIIMLGTGGVLFLISAYFRYASHIS